MMMNQSKQPLPQVRRVIAVASGKGGVGKSTVSVNLALALTVLGHQVGLLDADIYGPNQLQMLGLPSTKPPSEDGSRFSPLIAHGLEVISMACFMADDQPAIWRGPMASKALQQLFYQTLWGQLDYLIVDLPPGTGDIALTLAQKLPVDDALVVTTPQDVALADVRRAVMMFRKVNVALLGVIENMSYYTCANCKHIEHPFGQAGGERLAQQYQLSLLARLPLDAAMTKCGDEGVPIVVADPDHSHSRDYLRLAQQISG